MIISAIRELQLVGDAGAAAIVLLIAVTLSVFKPEGRIAGDAKPTPFVYGCWVAVGLLLFAIVLRHLSGGMMGH